jgi:hypothetical protein
MFVALPPPPAAVAPASAPSLEAAFALARAAIAPAADPVSVLSGNASVEQKLAAIDSLQSRIPREPRARQAASLDALAAAAASPSQPPAVRAKALAALGYAMPPTNDDAARSRALTVLLSALRVPGYRLAALRGLGPAGHDLTPADEARWLTALLDLLGEPVSGEERQTALLDLNSFLLSREDMPRSSPALVAALDARLLAPLEADPAGFVADPRNLPGARELAIAAVWTSARQRQALGDPAPAARVHALLVRLAALETDAGVREWIRTYRDAAPPPPFRAITTKRAPDGPDAP